MTIYLETDAVSEAEMGAAMRALAAFLASAGPVVDGGAGGVFDLGAWDRLDPLGRIEFLAKGGSNG